MNIINSTDLKIKSLFRKTCWLTKKVNELEAGGGTTLPSQTGNASKYLTTDGSLLSWGPITTQTLDAVPVDGSTNGIQSNAVFDGLALKANSSDLNLKQDSSSAVTLTGTQTITNKTISGSSNTISNIAQSSITGLVSSLSAKQDLLVSGTNIKTINGSTLLGAGDLTISGGGSTTDASLLTSGTLSDSRLSSNVPVIGTVSNGRYYRLNPYTKEPETFLPVTKSYNKTTITVGNESTYIDGVIYIKVGSLYYRKEFQGPVDIRWFGAVGDDTTDNRAAVQAAVDFATASGWNEIFIPQAGGQKFYWATKVNISAINFSVIGDAPVVQSGSLVEWNGYCRTATTSSCLFDFGNGRTTSPSGAYVVKGISFYSPNCTYNAPTGLSALWFTTNNNGPQRAVRIEGCSFGGYAKAIVASVATAGYVAILGFDIESCNFIYGTYAIYSDAMFYGPSSITKSQFEGGASIHMFSNGPITFEDNNIEDESIEVIGDDPWTLINNHYWEAGGQSPSGTNNAFIIHHQSYGQNGMLELGSAPYGLQITGATDIVWIDGIQKVVLRPTWYATKPPSITPAAGTTTGTLQSLLTFRPTYSPDNTTIPYWASAAPGSTLRGETFYVGAPNSGTGHVTTWLPPTEYLNELPSTGSRTQNLGSVTTVTPFGTTNTAASVTSAAPLALQNLEVGGSYAVGDWIVLSALVKMVGSTNAAGCQPYMNVRSNTGVSLPATYPLVSGGISFKDAWNDRWFLWTSVIQASVAGTYVRLAIGTSGNATPVLTIAGIGAYKIPSSDIITRNGASRALARPWIPYENTNYTQRNLSHIYHYQSLGSAVKGETFRCRLNEVLSGAGIALSSGLASYTLLDVPATCTISSVSFYQLTQGVYTANNTNEISIYSLVNGTLTKLGGTGDVPNLWKGAGSAVVTTNLTSSITLTPQLGTEYFVGFIYNSSAQTTAPAIGGNSIIAAVPIDYTNSAKPFGILATQTSLAATTQAMSGLGASGSRYCFWIN